MSPLAAPPGDLTHFPRRVLPPATLLARIHRAGRGAWWFSSDGGGRFDLDPPRGTCYLGESALASFVEVFRWSAVVAEPDVRARRLSWLWAPRELVLADSTVRPARAFGVTAAIHSTPDYTRTRAWARAFAAAGFDGVRYRVSHDPAQDLVGVALLRTRGPAGAHGAASAADAVEAAEDGAWPPGEPRPIGPDLLRAAREDFRILVLPEL